MALTNPHAFASEINKGVKLAEATFSSLVKLAVCQQQQHRVRGILIKEVGARLYEWICATPLQTNSCTRSESNLDMFNKQPKAKPDK